MTRVIKLKRDLLLLTIILAITTVLTQCKKNDEITPENVEETSFIFLEARIDSFSKLNVNPSVGTVDFSSGDIVYVASGGKYVGMLTSNGNSFSGNISNAIPDKPLSFYYLGNKLPVDNLTPGLSNKCSVILEDQTEQLPCIAYAISNERFNGSGLYTAVFHNKCALVKFDVTTISTSATCIAGINNTITIDFSSNSFSFDKSNNGVIKLPPGCGERWAVILPQPEQEEGDWGSIYSEDDHYMGKRPALPQITSNDYLSNGVALSVTQVKGAPEGSIAGLFTINANNQEVYFSQGNLQYQASTNTWRFAEKQWNYVGGVDYDSHEEKGNVFEAGIKCDNSLISSSYNGWIDLFGWATSDFDHGSVCYQPWSISDNSSDYLAYNTVCNLSDQTGIADWGYNTISNGGNAINLWRTLTKEEWWYLLCARETISEIRFAKAQVNNVNGIILLPDNWFSAYFALYSTNKMNVDYSANIISLDQWEVLEQHGAVFLPTAGWRNGINIKSIGTQGVYWSSSIALSGISNGVWHYQAYDFYINSNSILYEDRTYLDWGLSVRLVYDAK